eukprot:CAMPEP_0177614224 /NCGR_PEP_ID=MMETSP0419_2-20121207/22546_1 /TAXON_ID=582737 /ORGANISM="Tetraselmis sp., Strain GSL018" /LENGTH=229 /DNA_ID=CAMNT_0019111277 /DNA_START=150 /DNA_END=835 /DNA_ORIENTATION=+
MDANILRGIDLRQVKLKDLQNPSQETFKLVARAMSQEGMFVVNLPDVAADALAETLRSYAGCASASSAELPVSVLGDGTRRTSLALSVNSSKRSAVPEDVRTACPHFASGVNATRNTADVVGLAFARLMDELVRGSRVASETFDGTQDLVEPGTFQYAAVEAESLEHFHMYTAKPPGRDTEAAGAAAALEMHSDLGLFLVMAPTLLQADSLKPVAGSAPGEGLLLELPG